MTRDEWMVLPDGARLHKSLDGRQYAASSDGAAVITWTPYSENTGRINLPLAEFEALLFGCSPGSGEYERAAVELAEKHAWLCDAEVRLGVAVDRGFGDVDERRNEVSWAGHARDKAEAAFLALYREREARRG